MAMTHWWVHLPLYLACSTLGATASSTQKAWAAPDSSSSYTGSDARTAVSHLQTLCEHRGGSACGNCLVRCGSQSCAKTTAIVAKSGGATMFPIGARRTTKHPTEIVVKKVDTPSTNAYTLDLGQGDVISQECRLKGPNSGGFEQVPCDQLRQRMSEVVLQDSQKWFSEEVLLVEYITNDTLVIPMHEEDEPGLFECDVEGDLVEDGASTQEAAEVQAIVQRRVAAQPRHAMLEVCLDSVVPPHQQSVKPLRDILGDRPHFVVLNKGGKWLTMQGDVDDADLLELFRQLLEDTQKQFPRADSTWMLDVPIMKSTTGSVDEMKANRVSLRNAAELSSAWCTRMDSLLVGNPEIVSASPVLRECAARKCFDWAALQLYEESLFAQCVSSTVDNLNLDIAKDIRLVETETGRLQEGIRELPQFKIVEVTNDLLDRLRLTLSQVLRGDVSPKDVCKQFGGGQECKALVKTLLKSAKMTLREEFEANEDQCTYFPAGFAAHMLEYVAGAKEATAPQFRLKQILTVFKMATTMLEPQLFSTPDEFREELMEKAEIVGGVPDFNVGVQKLVAENLESLVFGAGKDFFVCILRRFFDRQVNLALDITMALFGFKYPSMMADHSRLLQMKIKEMIWECVEKVVLAPLEVLMEQDFDKLTFAKDATLPYHMSVIHIFLKRVRPTFMQVGALGGGSGSDGISSWASKMKGAVSKVWSTIRDVLTGENLPQDASWETNFQEAWNVFIDSNEEIGREERAKTLGSMKMNDKDRLMDFPISGMISDQKGSEALHVFHSYFTSFRELFNVMLSQSLAGHFEKAVVIEDCELKLALGKLIVSPKELEHVFSQNELRTRMSDELTSKQEQLTNLRALERDISKLRSLANNRSRFERAEL